MFPSFNFPQFWPEDDGRGHYSRNYLASDRTKVPPWSQAAYTDLGRVGGHFESVSQIAGFEPLTYQLVGQPVRLAAESIRGAGNGWPCNRERHRRVRLACVAACTASRHFKGRPSALRLPSVQKSRSLLREVAEAESLAQLTPRKLAKLPLHITQFLTAPPPPDAHNTDAGVDALGIDPLDPESLSNRLIGMVSGRHCGSGIVWADAADTVTMATPGCSPVVVAYASGKFLDTLRVSALVARRRKRRKSSSSGKARAPWRLVTQWTSAAVDSDKCDNQIYEVLGDSRSVEGALAGFGPLLAVRRRDKFQFYRQTEAADVASAESAALVSPLAESSPSPDSTASATSTVRLLSLALNPYIFGEAVTMDANMVAKLWDPRGLDACRWSRTFPAEQLAPWAPGEAWASASLGAHHRSLVCVGGRLADVCDLRASPSSTAGHRLFELPPGAAPERFRCRTGIGQHWHLLGSDGNLRLVDDRMLGNRCLLHAKCPLHAAPSLATWLPEPYELLLLGAQTTGDIAAVRLLATDASLPPRIGSEARLLLPQLKSDDPPDGLRGLAMVKADTNTSRSGASLLLFRMTGRGRLYLHSLADQPDQGADEAPATVRSKPKKTREKSDKQKQVRKRRRLSKSGSKFSLNLPAAPDCLATISTEQRTPALTLPQDRRTVDRLPHLNFKEFATPDEQAELGPSSLLLARLWHGQDTSGPERLRRLAYEARQFVDDSESVVAEDSVSNAPTNETLTDPDIFDSASSLA